MSAGLLGAVAADEVVPVDDDGDAIYSAAQRYYAAVSDAGSAASRASSSWSNLPDVLDADALTPELEPLMRPAQKLADDLIDSAEAVLRAASAARDEIADLKRDRRVLVSDIESFHASAPGRIEAHIRQQAASGNILGAVATTLMSWKDVPALVGEEFGLRVRVRAFNDRTATTLAALARRFGGIEAGSRGTDRLPDIGSPHASAALLDEGVAPTAVAALMGTSVAGLFTGLTERQIEKAPKENDGLEAWVAGLTPTQAAAWWNSLSKSQRAGALTAIPVILGALNGIPALSRVSANKENAAAALPGAEARVKKLQDELNEYPTANADIRGSWASELNVARQEVRFLKSATGDDPSVQLYLFDPTNSRIIQMLGTPSAKTTHVITYVPGTFTSMGSFYTGSVQQVPQRIVLNAPDTTVAFVYKDGIFPGENDATSAANLVRIEEANDEASALKDGSTLAGFQSGLSAADPDLAAASTVGIGHSWGLTDVTTSEVAGAHYNQVISLSGAGMVPQWAPNPHTTYTDFSYNDMLQQAQQLPGHPVWDGNVPRDNPAFQHGPYLVNPDAYAGDNPLKTEAQLLANHSLIASTSPANQAAVRDIMLQALK